MKIFLCSWCLNHIDFSFDSLKKEYENLRDQYLANVTFWYMNYATNSERVAYFSLQLFFISWQDAAFEMI